MHAPDQQGIDQIANGNGRDHREDLGFKGQFSGPGEEALDLDFLKSLGQILRGWGWSYLF